MILLLDNYDSFTWNLAHRLGELGAAVRVVRNDAMGVAEALALRPAGVVISPGPCTPAEAGISVELVRQAPPALPILGVCLGHQAIAAAHGARVGRCREVMHGKVSAIAHDGTGLFAGLPQELPVTRYHSLDVEEASLPPALRVTARSRSGVVMGLAHRERPVHGVQFHPESIATEAGPRLLANFLALLEPAA